MQAACVSCGYRFGGVAIKEGVLVCPECGEENAFELPAVNRSHLPFLTALRITFWILGGIALLAALLWMARAAGLFLKAKGG